MYVYLAAGVEACECHLSETPHFPGTPLMEYARDATLIPLDGSLSVCMYVSFSLSLFIIFCLMDPQPLSFYVSFQHQYSLMSFPKEHSSHNPGLMGPVRPLLITSLTRVYCTVRGITIPLSYTQPHHTTLRSISSHLIHPIASHPNPLVPYGVLKRFFTPINPTSLHFKAFLYSPSLSSSSSPSSSPGSCEGDCKLA